MMVAWLVVGGCHASCNEPSPSSNNAADAEVVGVPHPYVGPILRHRNPFRRALRVDGGVPESED